MALVSLRQLLDHAGEHSYGLPAFNVNNLEQMRAIMMAADKTDSPVIVQASAGARKYAGAPFLRHLILSAIEEWPHIPVVMHQDHGTSPAVCQRSIQLGFSSVMMDGSLREDGILPLIMSTMLPSQEKLLRWHMLVVCLLKVRLVCLAVLKLVWQARKMVWALKASWIIVNY